jgi:hypothetical protein
MQSKTDKKILVLSCARSGTRALAKSLMLSGVDIGHERLKVNGTICGHLAVDDYWYSSHWRMRTGLVRRSELEFDETWHQVRHPLSVIESIETGPNLEFWHFQEKHTGVSWDDKPIERVARYWLAWNDVIESNDIDFRFRIEDIDAAWPEMCRRFGIEAERPSVGSDYGAVPLKKLKRERERVEWSDLGIYEEPVRLKAKEYGYE